MPLGRLPSVVGRVLQVKQRRDPGDPLLGKDLILSQAGAHRGRHRAVQASLSSGPGGPISRPGGPGG